jgi:hypothetical protein
LDAVRPVGRIEGETSLQDPFAFRRTHFCRQTRGAFALELRMKGVVLMKPILTLSLLLTLALFPIVASTAHSSGSLGFRVVGVLDSPTCWGRSAKNPNKFGTPIRHPRKIPKTHSSEPTNVLHSTVERPTSLSDTESVKLPVSDPTPLDHAQDGQDRSLDVFQGRPFSVLSGPLADSAVQSPASDWHIECVDCPKQLGEFSVMTDRSLRLDAEGRPHIAYYGDHLYYAWHDGLEWQYEMVDSAPQVGAFAALALDAAGNPHISYYDWTNRDLKYARWTGGAWDIQIVDGEEDVGWDSSLALDDAGNPHISYYQEVFVSKYEIYSYLRYARWTGSDWDIQTVDGGGRFCSLALDSMGNPHISYHGNDGTKYAYWTGSEWDIQAVDSGESVGWYTSLALDAADHPHISYGERADDALKYAHWTGSTWDVQIVDSTAFAGLNSSLALDATGRPHISYRAGYDLRYAHWMGSSWDIRTVDNVETMGYRTSLALDAASTPHIIYYDETNRDLKYTHWTGSAWDIQHVGGEKWMCGDTSLALDAAGTPHIGYSDWTNEDLKYTHWVNGTWNIQVVDSEGSVGGYVSLVFDATGHPHISYGDKTNSALKYARWTGDEWDIQAVDSLRDPAWESSLALDALGRPHISYTGSDGALRHAHWTGSTWDIQTVDSEDGLFSSLALDAAGNPHISYYHNAQSGGRTLKYAYWTDGTWDVQTVDSEETSGSSSLALDAIGSPHISYYSNDGLKHAYWTGSDWDIQTVDSEGGWDNSLALDIVGNPCISYHGNDRLKYARWTGSDWDIQAVDDEGGWGSSLALDTVGIPHISYCSGTLEPKLKYARLIRPPLVLHKEVTPRDDLHIGSTLTYTLTLSNPGASVRLWDPLPSVVRHISGSITGTITPIPVYSPTAHAITWQGILPTDTIQAVRFQVTPVVTVVRSLTAPLPVANNAWLTDTDNHRFISATATVNLWPPPLFLGKQASPSGGLLNNGILTYTLTLSAPDLNVRLWDPLPPSVHYVPGSITDTLSHFSGTLVLPAAVYSSTAHAVIWAGRLSTDTAQMIRFQVTPGVTHTGSLSLSLPIVNTAWLTATESGRSVRDTAIVNGWHVYLPLVVRQP